MSNPLQQQLESLTPDQAIGLMQQAMGAIQGSRADHMLLAKAEDMIISLVRKGVEAGKTETTTTNDLNVL